MYDNYLFVLIYGLFVCMYVCTCPSKVGMSFLLCMQTKTLHIHIMFPPPPCGWVGGVLPSAAMYRYNFMFLLIYVWWLFVCIDLWFVCMYVCTCPSKVDMSLFLCLHTKILHVHIMFPPPPPVGGLGWSYHLQPCIGITICLYWFMYDNYLFVLIYGLFVCMYVHVHAR